MLLVLILFFFLSSTAEKLSENAPDVALLDMLGKLSSRLSDLDVQAATVDKATSSNNFLDVTFDQQKLAHLKSNIGTIGNTYLFDYLLLFLFFSFRLCGKPLSYCHIHYSYSMHSKPAEFSMLRLLNRCHVVYFYISRESVE